jgi:glutamate N-acetyltransferase/amino-acid N-acetyltransferase
LAKRYSERRTKKYMRNNSILIEIDLGVGDSQSSIWTCDLTEKYIKINADYRS